MRELRRLRTKGIKASMRYNKYSVLPERFADAYTWRGKGGERRKKRREKKGREERGKRASRGALLEKKVMLVSSTARTTMRWIIAA